MSSVLVGRYEVNLRELFQEKDSKTVTDWFVLQNTDGGITGSIKLDFKILDSRILKKKSSTNVTKRKKSKKGSKRKLSKKQRESSAYLVTEGNEEPKHNVSSVVRKMNFNNLTSAQKNLYTRTEDPYLSGNYSRNNSGDFR